MSAIISPTALRAWEAQTFSRGITPGQLMDEAGARIAAAVQQFFPRPGACLVVFGKGHNGGDGLVAAMHLAFAGWKTHLIPAQPRERWTPLTTQKYEEAGLAQQYAPGLEGFHAAVAAWRSDVPRPPLVILDALLGTGARPPLKAPLLELTQAINQLRAEEHAHVFALDIPSGLDGETGAADPHAVVADFTLAIGAAKNGLVADKALPYVGRLAVLPLAELDREPLPIQGEAPRAAIPPSLRPLLPARPFDLHKGDCGRIALVAGSRGFIGAALMASAACVHSGAGLVALYVPEEIYPIVAGAALSEVMVHPVQSLLEVRDTRHDVLAIGPGLGRARDEEVLALLRQSQVPTILDADALNVASEHLDLLREAPAPRLLTPHPGEMARLAPNTRKLPRAQAARQFTETYPVTLLLKGSRTVVAERGRPLSYNTTGSPGMATGGMGDVLTGVCAALAGQKLSLYDAARLGAWVCGRAAEAAIFEGTASPESLSPSVLLQHLGPAWRALRVESY